MTVWRAVAALHFTGCRGCDRLRDRRRFLRRWPDNLVDGFSGAERRRALNIGALVVSDLYGGQRIRERAQPENVRLGQSMMQKEYGLNYEKRHSKQGIQINLSLKEKSYGD